MPGSPLGLQRPPFLASIRLPLQQTSEGRPAEELSEQKTQEKMIQLL